MAISFLLLSSVSIISYAARLLAQRRYLLLKFQPGRSKILGLTYE
jgi:hypothetical protein